MKLYYFVSCILAAGSLVVFPKELVWQGSDVSRFASENTGKGVNDDHRGSE